jgi:hypothetical protein
MHLPCRRTAERRIDSGAENSSAGRAEAPRRQGRAGMRSYGRLDRRRDGARSRAGRRRKGRRPVSLSGCWSVRPKPARLDLPARSRCPGAGAIVRAASGAGAATIPFRRDHVPRRGPGFLAATRNRTGPAGTTSRHPSPRANRSSRLRPNAEGEAKIGPPDGAGISFAPRLSCGDGAAGAAGPRVGRVVAAQRPRARRNAHRGGRSHGTGAGSGA